MNKQLIALAVGSLVAGSNMAFPIEKIYSSAELGICRRTRSSKGRGVVTGKKRGNWGTLFRDRADQFRPYESKACARRRRQMQKGGV